MPALPVLIIRGLLNAYNTAIPPCPAFLAAAWGNPSYSTFLKCTVAIPHLRVLPSLNIALTFVICLLSNSSLLLHPVLLTLSDSDPSSPSLTISPLHSASVTISSMVISTATMSGLPTVPLFLILSISPLVSSTPLERT